MVKLLKYKNGRWVVVDYGIKKLADLYIKMGYIVMF